MKYQRHNKTTLLGPKHFVQEALHYVQVALFLVTVVIVAMLWNLSNDIRIDFNKHSILYYGFFANQFLAGNLVRTFWDRPFARALILGHGLGPLTLLASYPLTLDEPGFIYLAFVSISVYSVASYAIGLLVGQIVFALTRSVSGTEKQGRRIWK